MFCWIPVRSAWLTWWPPAQFEHADCIHLCNFSVYVFSLPEFCMLLFAYQPPFSSNPHRCLSLSLSTATSVHEHWGWLLPTLAVRGGRNALRMALTDSNYMRLGTVTNTEHMQNVISMLSSALTTSNEGEETLEVREEKEWQREEAREYTLSDVPRPTRVLSPVVFNKLVGHVMRDVSALRSSTCNPWASLNWRYDCSYVHKPYVLVNSTGSGLYKSPIPSSPLPAPTGIIETIQHPHGIGPTKPIIVVPISKFSITTHTPCIHTGVMNTTPPGHITPSCHSSTLISNIAGFSSTILLHLLSFFRLLEVMKALPWKRGHLC